MKKGLTILLTIICIMVPAVPAFNNIDAFVRQDSKLLVIDRPIDTFIIT